MNNLSSDHMILFLLIYNFKKEYFHYYTINIKCSGIACEEIKDIEWYFSAKLAQFKELLQKYSIFISCT